MTEIDIIQSLCDAMLENVDIKDLPYKKEDDDVTKWTRILKTYMQNDKKFQQVFSRYEVAEGQYLSAACDYYYREGFLCGARLALEICGYTNKND